MRDTIQSLWIGDRLSALEQLSIKSFQWHGHPYELYTYGPVQGIPANVTIRDANTILPSHRITRTVGVSGVPGSLAPFADMFRYKLLAMRGGWWVDTDFICMKPFEFDAPYVFVGDDIGVTSALMKVPQPNDPFITWVYEETEKVFSTNVPWGVTGNIPGFGANKFGLMKYHLEAPLFFPINEQALFAPALSEENQDRIETAYSVHCFNELLRISGFNKDGQYSASSLYERMLRKYGVR